MLNTVYIKENKEKLNRNELLKFLYNPDYKSQFSLKIEIANNYHQFLSKIVDSPVVNDKMVDTLYEIFYNNERNKIIIIKPTDRRTGLSTLLSYVALCYFDNPMELTYFFEYNCTATKTILSKIKDEYYKSNKNILKNDSRMFNKIKFSKILYCSVSGIRGHTLDNIIINSNHNDIYDILVSYSKSCKNRILVDNGNISYNSHNKIIYY